MSSITINNGIVSKESARRLMQILLLALAVLMVTTFSVGGGAVFLNGRIRANSIMPVNIGFVYSSEKQLNIKSNFLQSNEWLKFKNLNEQNCKINEREIEEMIAQFSRLGRPIDKESKNTFESLKRNNLELKHRLVLFENEQNNWVSFKEKYDFDMNMLKDWLNVMKADHANLLPSYKLYTGVKKSTRLPNRLKTAWF